MNGSTRPLGAKIGDKFPPKFRRNPTIEVGPPPAYDPPKQDPPKAQTSEKTGDKSNGAGSRTPRQTSRRGEKKDQNNMPDQNTQAQQTNNAPKAAAPKDKRAPQTSSSKTDDTAARVAAAKAQMEDFSTNFGPAINGIAGASAVAATKIGEAADTLKQAGLDLGNAVERDYRAETARIYGTAIGMTVGAGAAVGVGVYFKPTLTVQEGVALGLGGAVIGGALGDAAGRAVANWEPSKPKADKKEG